MPERSDLRFRPAPDVAVLAHALLDIYERRDPDRPAHRSIRVRLADLPLPGYFSQVDPGPRLAANEQLQVLAGQGLVGLAWMPGEAGELLEAVTLAPEQAAVMFGWLGRAQLATQRAVLRDLLLADRFRFEAGDWRRLALEHTLSQLRAGKSPAPFVLADPDLNQNLLRALVGLEQIHEETPYRVFSVRVYNDSKLFEAQGIRYALATLAHRHGWPNLAPDDALAEAGLVANPTHLYLYGPLQLTDLDGRTVKVGDFYPAVGVPALLAGRLAQVTLCGPVSRVVCVENLASFYELVRYEGQGLAAICLLGNPAPATRHLLTLLAGSLPDGVPLYAWPDLDFGGLNILAQLRRLVSPRFMPHRLDVETLETHIRWARPLTENDRQLLSRLLGYSDLADLHSLIEYMLVRGLKLEQEAIILGR